MTIELGYGLVLLADERKGAPLVTRLTACAAAVPVVRLHRPAFRIRDRSISRPTAIVSCSAGRRSARPRSVRIAYGIDTGEAAPARLARRPHFRPSFGCPALGSSRRAPTSPCRRLPRGRHESVIATHVNQLLAARPQELLGPDQVRELLDTVRERNAQLIETITPQPLSLAAITRVMRSLLADGISLAHPLPVLASLSQAAQQTTEHDRLIDMVRADLGALIVGAICAPDARLPVITLAAELEEMVVGGMQDPTNGQVIVEPDLARSRASGSPDRDVAPAWRRRPALVVQPRARRPMSALLKLRAPGCLVISINELPVAQPIEVIAVIGGESEQPQQTQALAEATPLPDYEREPWPHDDAEPIALSAARAYRGEVGDGLDASCRWCASSRGTWRGSAGPSTDVDDLMQAGLVALTECAQRHEGPGEDGFAAYAKLRVRGAMVDLLRSSSPEARGTREKRRLVERTEQALRLQLGRAPKASETAAALGLSVIEFEKLRSDSAAIHVDSIDECYSDSSSMFAAGEDSAESLLLRDEDRGRLIEEIRQLPERLQMVIQLYFVEELNLSEIAQVLSVSIPRVHQLKAAALDKLRLSLAD